MKYTRKGWQIFQIAQNFLNKDDMVQDASTSFRAYLLWGLHEYLKVFRRNCFAHILNKSCMVSSAGSKNLYKESFE